MKAALCVFIIALVWIPFASAKETFYCALESKESVEKQGGTVKGGKFVPGKFGNGYISEKDGDVILFPIQGRFTNLKAGTVEFWVKVGYDVPKLTREAWLFSTYKTPGDCVAVALDGKWSTPAIGRTKIKSAGKWYQAKSKPVDWKKDEIHHMAGTWGQDGAKLYFDGELAASHSFKGGPAVFAETFAINNHPSDFSLYTGCVIDEVRISDNQKKPDEFVTEATTSVQPEAKVSVTWGRLKSMY